MSLPHGILEYPKGWAKPFVATEITEFFEKKLKISVGSPGTEPPGRCVAKPMELDTPR